MEETSAECSGWVLQTWVPGAESKNSPSPHGAIVDSVRFQEGPRAQSWAPHLCPPNSPYPSWASPLLSKPQYHHRHNRLKVLLVLMPQDMGLPARALSHPPSSGLTVTPTSREGTGQVPQLPGTRPLLRTFMPLVPGARPANRLPKRDTWEGKKGASFQDACQPDLSWQGRRHSPGLQPEPSCQLPVNVPRQPGQLLSTRKIHVALQRQS